MRLRLIPAALLLALPALGAVPSDTIKIKLADGTYVTGEATEYDENTKTLHFTTEDGKEVSYSIDQLDGRYAYQVARHRVEKDDGPGQLKLANFARDVGLYAHAARHYRQAEQADPSLKPEVELQMAVSRKEAATWCYDNAVQALAKNDKKGAEKWLETILNKLPNEAEAAKASEMLDALYSEKSAAHAEKFDAADPTLLTGDLKKGKTYYDRMLAKNKEGLLANSASSKATKAWKAAVKDGERALAEIKKVEKKKKDPGTLELTANYAKAVNEEIIEVYTNMASSLTARSSYQQAMSEVNKALAIDPGNASAKSMRARVEEASSRSGGIWW